LVPAELPRAQFEERGNAMAEENHATAKKPENTAKKPNEDYDRGQVPMTEEMDSARWTLPPLGIVAIALVAIAVIVGVIAWQLQPKPVASGKIDDVFAVATQDGRTMAAIKVTFSNVGSGRPLWIRNLKAKVTTASGDHEDEAASAVDFDRYFQAYPALKEHVDQPLKVETRVPAGLQAQGSIIVAYPISVDEFNNRKSLTVTIEPYDQKPLVITKK
jgi:hypothetical protein